MRITYRKTEPVRATGWEYSRSYNVYGDGVFLGTVSRRDEFHHLTGNHVDWFAHRGSDGRQVTHMRYSRADAVERLLDRIEEDKERADEREVIGA